MADAGALLGQDSFADQRFEGGDLTGADLGGRELSGCVFKGVRLAETRWREARLEDCRFEDCDLSRLAPDAMGARGVVFAGCKMMGIDWSNLGGYPAMSFERCDLRKASFAGSTGLTLAPEGNQLRGAKIPVETALRLAESFGLHVLK